MSGSRTHEHGFPGHKHHDEHLGGDGRTHLEHATDFLKGPESRGARDGLNHQMGHRGQKLAVGAGRAKVDVR